MNISEVMTSQVECISPGATIQDAANKMKELDIGCLPVCDEAQGKLVGMVTDRDMTIRAVAEAQNPGTTRVRDVMTPGIRFCFEDDDINTVAKVMEEHQIRRLPVLNREKKLVGIVSVGDLAVRAQEGQVVAEVLEEVCQPVGSARKA